MLCQCCQCSASVARYIHRIVCCVSVVVSCGYCGSIVSRECCVCGAGSSLSHTPTQVTTHEAIKYFITDTRGSCTRARRDEHHDQARTKERSRVRGPVPRVRVNQRIQARVRRLLRKCKPTGIFQLFRVTPPGYCTSDSRGRCLASWRG